jgi:hypothetical protein
LDIENPPPPLSAEAFINAASEHRTVPKLGNFRGGSAIEIRDDVGGRSDPMRGTHPVLVVSEVRGRAENARSSLRRQLTRIEREVWALDVEKEVLLTVKETLGRCLA